MGGRTGHHVGRRIFGVLTSGLIVAGLISGVTPTTSGAATCTTSWKAAVSGSWNTAANWTHGVPKKTTDACITLTGTYTVTVSQVGTAARSLQVGAGDGVQTLSIAGDCAKPDEPVLTLGADSEIGTTGRLALTFQTCTVATVEQASGTLTSNGTILLNGQRLAGGLLNHGLLDIAGDVSQLDAEWTNDGQIIIEDGSWVLFEQFSSLRNDGTVKALGTGRLTFTNGTTYLQGSGRLLGATPIEIVNGSLYYDGAGPGTIRVRDGVDIHGDISRHQTLSVVENCIDDRASITSQDFTGWENRGTILFTSNTTCQTETEVQSAGFFINRGTVRTAATFQNTITWGGGIANHGVFAIGAACQVSFDKYFLYADSTTAIELAGRRTFSRLDFTTLGTSIVLNGTLAITTVGDYWPTSGTAFVLMRYADREGAFASVTGTTKAGEDVVIGVKYTDDGVRLKAT